MNRLIQRPLAGIYVGLSISESENSSDLGFSREEVNRCVIRLSQTLLGAGARLVFGHDWRPGGVMEEISRLAPNFQDVDSNEPSALILNFVPWPDEPALDEVVRRQLHGLVEIRQTGLPEDLEELSYHREDPILRAFGLSHLRAHLTSVCDARVCLGGRTKSYSGWFPGVFEEALLACKKDRPVYASGILGGAAADLIERAQCGKPASFRPNVTTAMDQSPLLERLAPKFSEIVLQADRFGFNEGLNADDAKKLMDASEMDEVVVLVLRGLKNLAPKLREKRER